MSEQFLWSSWQRFLRRIHTHGHMSQCEAVAWAGSVGFHCQLVYSHDGPHLGSNGLWFWRDYENGKTVQMERA